MKSSHLVVALALVSTVAATTSGQERGQATAAERLFVLKVRPLLRGKCLGCHGKEDDKIESEFDLRTRKALLRGGEQFGAAVLVPGRADKSRLYAMVLRKDEGQEMPPKEADKLTLVQTNWIRDWINGGAPWPNDQRSAQIYERYAAGVVVKTSGGLSKDWTERKYEPQNLWSFRPLWRDKTGLLKKDRRHPVDILIGARLEKAGLRSAALANRRTLIRRASFDLLGLPPSPQDVERFVKDPRPDDVAFSELVNRLLAKPQYGEQWGRHWLDVVRYADSSGFANDWERPNAWRYRDYVVRAFNDDKPYDEFVREQLAGDELAIAAGNRKEGPGKKQSLTNGQSEQLIAAGFLRMGPWEHTGMSVARVTRQQFLDDITDSVGQVFLGHALQCCRCHDHKFDPIPTRDYYSVQAVFATTQFAEVDAPWLKKENLGQIVEDHRYHSMRDKANQERLSRLARRQQDYVRSWFKEKGLPYKSRQQAIKAKAPPKHIPPRKVGMTPDDFGQERISRKWRQKFAWEFDRYKPIALTVYNGKTNLPKNSSGRMRRPADPLSRGKLEKTAILKGGDVFAPAQLVTPAVLSAVPGGLDYRVGGGVSGRRTALADWIVDRRNTLTSRVIANRVWQYHFGRGIAANPNNLGATGKKPTHPRLLDWLAGELMSNGWSIKHLHRVIMLSQAYRRSSADPTPERLSKQDPDGELYSSFRPRRLEAEEIRDAMLAVSGELNQQIGGIPSRPDMNLEAALQPRMIMGTFAPAYVPNPKPAQRNRRSVYALKLRGQRDPFLEIFNQPGSEKSCELRDTSTVTPQALTMMNSQETYDRALALAARLQKEAATGKQAIVRLFRLVYGRPPSDDEVSAALAHWKTMEAVEAKIDYQPGKFPTSVVRRASEENTGEPFTFTEQLLVYRDYVPDLQPHQVDARTRGLANVCLTVLNSNEFIYVY